MKPCFVFNISNLLKKAFIAVLAVLCSGFLWGETYRWNDAVTSGDWNVASNWEYNESGTTYITSTTVPGIDDTIFIRGSASVSITIPAGYDAKCKVLCTNSDASESGNIEIIVNGTLTIAGDPDDDGAETTNATANKYNRGLITNSGAGNSGNTKIVINNDCTFSNIYVNSIGRNYPSTGSGYTEIEVASGKKLTVTSRIEMSGRAVSSANSELRISGSGEVSCKIYDPATNAAHTQTVDIGTNATFSITEKYFGDAGAAGISPFTGSGTLRIPASGAIMNWGTTCGFTYDSNLKILPIGSPDQYTVSFTGLSNFPTSPINITITRKNNGGSAAIYYPYKVTNFVNTASETFTLDKDYSTAKVSQTDTTLSGTSEGFLYIAGTATSETITLSYSTPANINGNDGFSIDVYTPDSARVLATLEWYSGKLTWTGETSTDWEVRTNWIGLDAGKTIAENLANVDLTINASASKMPDIKNGAYSLKSLTIAPNASITISGGELEVPTITVATTGSRGTVTQTGGTLKIKDFNLNGNSSYTATGGTIEPTTADSKINVAAENNLSFYNISIPSGTGLTVNTNGSDGKISASGTVSVEGNLTALNGIFIENGGELQAKADSFNSSPVTNKGTLSLYTNISSFGTFTNTTDAVVSINTNSLTLPSTWSNFGNGKLLVSSGVTGTKLGTAITALKEIEIQSGADLSLETFDTSVAKITNAGTLDIKAATLTCGTGTSYSGSGKLIINGGTFEYSGAAVTIPNLEVTTSATLNGGNNGITFTNITYNAAPAIETKGIVSIPGGTIGALTISSGTTTHSLGTALSATNILVDSGSKLITKDNLTVNSLTINSSGNITGADGKEISLSGNFTNNADSTGFTSNKGTIKFTDSAILTGATNFYNFTAENLSSKTLTINNDIKVNGTLKLSGADYSNPLTIAGTGTLTLQTSQTGGKFLIVSDVGRISTATTTYTATVSRSTNTPVPDGWILNNIYKWNGTGTVWTNASSWNIETAANTYVSAATYPQNNQDEVIIDNTSTNVAKLSADITLKKVTVNANATLDLANFSLTVPSITNNGTIKLYGTGSQNIKTDAGGTVTLTNGNNSIIEYYGGTSGSEISVSNFFTTSFNTLKVNQYTTLTLGTKSLSATALENEGTITINGTGTINQTDTDSGLFIYSGTTAIKNYKADGSADYYNLILSANYTTPASVELNIANKLTIDSGKTITLNGNLVAATIENNGQITCGTKNLTFADYSGTADTISINGGTITNNSTNPIMITTLFPGATESTLSGGTGTASISVTNSFSSGKLKTQGNITAKGTLTGLNINSGTFTASGDVTLSGTGAYLTVTDTLDINSHNLILTGTSADKLEVTGNGSIKNLTNQINGTYISIDTSATTTCPVISGGIYTATYSSTAIDNPINGWNILSSELVYVWNGSTSTDLRTAANWNTNITPVSTTGSTDSIIIPALSAPTPKWPILTANVEYNNVTINQNAEFDFVTFSLTCNNKFTNNGTIKFSGTSNTIIATSKSYGAANTIKYYGTSPNAVTGTGAPAATDYKNLTIASGTKLLLNDSSIIAGGTLSNEGTIEINGNGVFDIASGGTTDSDSGLIKYTSTTATKTAIPNIGFYNLEITTGTWSDYTNAGTSSGLSVANDFTISGGTLTSNGAISANKVNITGGTVNFNGNLTITTSLSVTDTISTPTVNFNNGTGGQTSSMASASLSKGTISFGNNSADNFNITGTDENLTLAATATFTTAGTISANKNINVGTNLSATANTTYSSPVNLTTDCTISNTTSSITFSGTIDGAYTLTTSGTGSVTFGNSVGATSALKAISIQGALTLNSTSRKITTTTTQDYKDTITINSASPSADVEFTGTKITFENTISLGDSTTITAENVILKNNVTTSSETNYLSVKADLETTAITISPTTMLDGNFYGTTTPLSGLPTFQKSLFIHDSQGTKTTNIEINEVKVNGDLIFDAERKITTKGKITAGGNIVLYRGKIEAQTDNILAAEKDIVLLGPGYCTKNPVTANATGYLYQQTRLSDWNYKARTLFTDSKKLPDGSAFFKGETPNQAVWNVTDAETFTNTSLSTSFTGSYKSAGNSTLKAGKNFYANGVTLTGTTTWYIDIPDITTGSNGFAEAYYCTVDHSTVRCHNESSTSHYQDGSKARIPAYYCTDVNRPSDNKWWIFPEFQIEKAYTVRDNVIYILFNRPIRNSSDELKECVSRITNTDGTKNFTGFYIDADCTTAVTTTSTLPDSGCGVFIKSSASWNTDAGNKYTTTTDGFGNEILVFAPKISSGSTSSTDHKGEKQTTLPNIEIKELAPNDAGSQHQLSDIWGKRLHYYESTERFENVIDKTGPVLYSVRTGQELHTTPDGTAASQHSYDSHNFIEFRYSEPVNFGSENASECDVYIPAFDSTDAINLVENIQVTQKFGALSGSITSQGELNFTGLGTIQNGLIHTGSQGSTNKLVNALYRLDEYSLRISIAGYTNGTVTDESGNTYKNWIGYIEKAVAPTGTVTMNFTTTNPLVTDLLGNKQEKYTETADSHNNTIPEINKKADGSNYPSQGVYGDWDISEPIFAPVRMQPKNYDESTNWTPNLISRKYQVEAIGNNSGVGSTLDRIEFHILDNTPYFDPTKDIAEWVSEIGWCNPNSSGTKEDLYEGGTNSIFYTADIFGGARQFAKGDQAVNRTSGGIRYSSLYNSASAFKYTTENNKTPNLSFDNSQKAYIGANAVIFSGTSTPRRSALDKDGLYFGFSIGSTNYGLKTTFTVSYDSSNSYITDLAGNRLRSQTFTTIDRTPPSFDITLGPIGQKEIFVTFVKQLITDSKRITYINNDGNTRNVSNSGTYEQILPKCFKLITIDENGIAQTATTNAIDTSKPAEVTSLSNDSFTCIKLYTTNNITLSDVENLYLTIVNHPDYAIKSRDPSTDHIDSRVTFIQDWNKNYMEMYTAHALSDFAINSVNSLYAYDEDMSAEDSQIMYGLYQEGSWAVHDWNAEQKNYGTLPNAHNLAIVANTTDGTTKNTNIPDNITLYLSDEPTANSVSTQFNKDLSQNLRIWLPDVTNKVFTAIASSNNKNYVTSQGKLLNEKNASEGFIFHIPQTVTSKWKNNSQISFLYGIMDSQNKPVTIVLSPELDLDNTNDTKIQYLPTGIKYPLYALRLKDNSDITSIDLWSFKVRNITEQRGGVTILNNVINNTVGEKTIVKVNLPSESKLNVIVMTLDGNVVKYLNRGNTSAGEHYYAWDGKNQNGKPVARGMYFIRISGDSIDETRKVIVVK